MDLETNIINDHDVICMMNSLGIKIDVSADQLKIIED